MMDDLIELDAVEILAIIDNELDPISPCINPAVEQTGGLRYIGPKCKLPAGDVRGDDVFELRMGNICCSAHGLSLLITAVKGDQRRTILFDAGPEAHSFERNSIRLGAKLDEIETIVLSHWHRDHSGGMEKALDMIYAARGEQQTKPRVQIDLHPDRPFYRGFQPPGYPPVSLEADPTLDELQSKGGNVVLNDKAHTIIDSMFLVSGEIPRTTAYEQGLKFGKRFIESSREWVTDEKMLDERLLMCKLKGKGIVAFTGCAHAGVVNSARYAVELGNGSSLYAVVGGFHLADATPEVIDTTVVDLAALKPSLLMPGHCTGWRAKFAMAQKMPGQIVPCFVGSGYKL